MNESATNQPRQLAALPIIEVDVTAVTTSRNVDRLMTIATMLFLDSKEREGLCAQTCETLALALVSIAHDMAGGDNR